MSAQSGYRAGYVAIVGRPNVGKSTLLNCLVGQKISITSQRPQTTRHRLLGILTQSDAQFVFVDTPGLQSRHGSQLNRLMNRAATQSLEGVDAIVVVVEALRFTAADRAVLDILSQGTPVVAAVNKVDTVADKQQLLPFIAKLSGAFPFHAIVPISAATGLQTTELLDTLKPLLPISAPVYGEDEITDRSERFLAAELIREKLFRLLGDEVPYATAVEIERFEVEGKLRRISASILVERAGQKPIVIGKGGEKLKAIGSQARSEMETLFGGKVFLELWVKVRKGWMDDSARLKSLGYD
ncbi:MAG TPA: GTPase Era [Burkholderiales bacterium]|nr:GTPase Era [Burkholderiales bacterium]